MQTLLIRLATEERAALDVMARRRGWSRAAVLRQALLSFAGSPAAPDPQTSAKLDDLRRAFESVGPALNQIARALRTREEADAAKLAAALGQLIRLNRQTRGLVASLAAERTPGAPRHDGSKLAAPP